MNRLPHITTSSADTDKPHAAMPRSPVPQRRGSPPDSSGSRSPTPSSASNSPARLRKPAPASIAQYARAGSADYTDREPTLPSLADLQYGSPAPLVPPPTISGEGRLVYSRGSSPASVTRFTDSRPQTPTNYSRPATPSLIVPGQLPMTPTSPQQGRGTPEHKKEKKGFFGRSKKDEGKESGPMAWIAGHPERAAYDLRSLLEGRPLPEMWDDSETGNCFVYLFPKESGRGASFKVDSSIFAASPILTRMAFGDIYSHPQSLDSRVQSLGVQDRQSVLSDSSHDSRGRYSTLSDDAQAVSLYITIRLHSQDPAAALNHTPSKSNKKEPAVSEAATEDIQTLVDIRNFFAFLVGGPLVATQRKSGWYEIFMAISGILKTYEFSNADGSTFGEVAASSFDAYVEELGLADVRGSREKTIEGVVLGERMKSVLLFNEAFTHAVGKLDEIHAMRSPKFGLISSLTQNRLARAAMDLEKRLAAVRVILNDFDFPFIFSGIMNSKQSAEHKEGVRFGEWKDCFMGMRKWALGMYTSRYGHWPPKAKSKKNNLETSGLNRLVLRDLYRDMGDIYDLMVDRANLTTRTVDGINQNRERKEEATIRALRMVLSEYDRSSPPVKPPIPFDLPLLPTLKTTRPDFGKGDKKNDLKAIQKRLKDDEIHQLLRSTWNGDVVVTPFIDAFRDMERRAAHHCTIAEMVDLRIGQWIFMYAVLQALPLLACDAPGLKHTKGVEYFLCEPPRSGVPWAHGTTGGAAAGKSQWFAVGGEGGNVVHLPSDVVEHSVEGIYRRSHCWIMAEKWTQGNAIMHEALHEQEAMNAAQSAALGDGMVTSLDAPAIHAPPLPLQTGSLSNSAMQPGSRPGSPISFSRPMTPVGSRPGSPVLGGLSPVNYSPNTPGGPMRYQKRNSSLGLGFGLEALPLPPGVTPDGRPATPDGTRRSVHLVDSSKTFDAILGGLEQEKGKEKGKKKGKR